MSRPMNTYSDKLQSNKSRPMTAYSDMPPSDTIIKELEVETEQLLQSIKKSQAVTKPAGKSLTKTSSFRDAKSKTKDFTKRRSNGKDKEGTAVLDYTSKYQNTLEKTRKLFDQGEGRATVEVLDDASPDTTPRQDYDYNPKKQQQKLEQGSITTPTKQKVLTNNEYQYGQLPFEKEKDRVAVKEDVFVPAPGVTITDVELERQRLARIEESSRAKQEDIAKNMTTRRQYLAMDRAAIKIQSLLRGCFGRKKFILTKRLHEMLASDQVGHHWIEVRDKDKGQVWYYNTESGVSQWDRPAEMDGVLAVAEKLKKLPVLGKTSRKTLKTAPASTSVSLPSLEKPSQKGYSQTSDIFNNQSSSHGLRAKTSGSVPNQGRRLTSASMSSFPMNDHREEDSLNKDQIQKDIQAELGVTGWMPPDGLSAPDGSFKPQLHSTVLAALSDQRFNSMASVLADPRWLESASTAPGLSSTSSLETSERVDLSRKPMVSVLTFNKKKSKKVARINVNTELDANGRPLSAPTDDLSKLTIRDVSHPGFEGGASPSIERSTTICFGCWSSGSSGCYLHPSETKLAPSRTMLLCRNWELDVMRRRYRSEEIQEVFMKQASSIKYDVRRKKFLTVAEQRHPIYRLTWNLLVRFNFKSSIIIKVQRWLWSFTEVIRSGTYKPIRTAEKAKLIRLRRSLNNATNVQRYSDHIRSMMPIAPITGYSWPERIGTEKYLFDRIDKVLSCEVDIIQAFPTPHPIALYLAREYHLSPPISIPMPTPEYPTDSMLPKVLPANEYVAECDPCAWVERLSSSIARDAVRQASEQIKALTPLNETELLSRAKYPIPTTIKFATLGRKPTPGMMAVGGLAVELLVAQLITTFIPAQYGHLMIMDKAAVSPGLSPEITISFLSLPMLPVTQPYKDRPVDHPLNYRRAPTIGINSMMNPDNKVYYGENRPDQTGEHISHGFRTSVYARHLSCLVRTDAHVFTPGADIASLNATSNHLPVTTHADSTYPFCDPSTRDNTTLDFYHLLLTGTTTMPKPQVFTALTSQEPGDFMRQSKPELPMGHCVVSIYRSWAFTQRDVIEEFYSDEGVKYWYNRRTGQTFWERPLLPEEEESPLKGGTKLNMNHAEEPMATHAGEEGYERRYHQGELRKNMLTHHETTKEARSRRLQAHMSASVARKQGVLPPLDESLLHQDIRENEHVDEDDAPIDSYTEREQRKMSMNSVMSHMSEEAGLVNSQGMHRSLRPPIRQMQVLGTLEEYGDEESVLAQQSRLTTAPVADHKSNSNSADNTSPESVVPGIPAAPPIDLATLTQLTATIGEMLSASKIQKASPQDMIQLGLGMGIALMQSQIQVGQTQQQVSGSTQSANTASSPSQPHESTGPLGLLNNAKSEGSVVIGSEAHRNIGAVHPTSVYAEGTQLDHSEEKAQQEDLRNLLSEPLSCMQLSSELKVVTETPDVLYSEMRFEEGDPLNADEELQKTVPVQVYPELFTRSVDHPSELEDYKMHPVAGAGKSFILKKDGATQHLVPGTKTLRRVAAPLPVGFFEAMKAKHVAKQEVDYLPQVPNLPQSRTVGRVKPRSAAVDWLAIQFDPWSAGKNPLNIEFVTSLQSDMEKLYGLAKTKEELESMKLSTNDGVLDVADRDGLNTLELEANKAQQIAEDFKKMTSLARHGKFGEVEEMMDQPDWCVPIDYQDDTGNALIHIAAQNGNKRIVKLCLRRGANINLQNINGQSAIHFAYAYGYDKLGQYIIKKGGDDSLRNKDGLTCYEGLDGAELSLL